MGVCIRGWGRLPKKRLAIQVGKCPGCDVGHLPVETRWPPAFGALEVKLPRSRGAQVPGLWLRPCSASCPEAHHGEERAGLRGRGTEEQVPGAQSSEHWVGGAWRKKQRGASGGQGALGRG